MAQFEYNTSSKRVQRYVTYIILDTICDNVRGADSYKVHAGRSVQSIPPSAFSSHQTIHHCELQETR